jgi:hypothetical protein
MADTDSRLCDRALLRRHLAIVSHTERPAHVQPRLELAIPEGRGPVHADRQRRIIATGRFLHCLRGRYAMTHSTRRLDAYESLFWYENRASSEDW